MIKCNLCNKKFYDVVLEENEKGDDIFCCATCFNGKVKHRVYIETLKVKEKEPKKIEVKKTKDNTCSGCRNKQKLYLKFGKYQFCFDCSVELYF